MEMILRLFRRIFKNCWNIWKLLDLLKFQFHRDVENEEYSSILRFFGYLQMIFDMFRACWKAILVKIIRPFWDYWNDAKVIGIATIASYTFDYIKEVRYFKEADGNVQRRKKY